MRALARWGITPLLAAPVGAWALGLGDIELESGLNQPFSARIALSATPDELQGLRVSLADGDTFARYGLDRPAFFNGFEFRVVMGRDGSNAIQITSLESVAEPFVTLLLEATWPRGRTLREYTVLLDPPVLLPAPAAPPAVRAAETRQPNNAASGGQITRPAPTPAPAPAPVAPPPAQPSLQPAPGLSNAPAPREPAELGGSYGPVQPAETLWAIAERLRPAGVTTNQMMMAVYQANADAFGGNINLLRAGATLRLPDAASLQSMTVTVANAEVQRQADEWRDRAGNPQVASRQLRLLPPPSEATAPAPAPVATPAPQPGSATAGGAGAQAAAAAAAAAAAEESRRLLEVRDAELRRLQEQAAAPAVAEPPPAEAAAPGVELESEQLFADETPPAETAANAAPPAEAPPAPAPQATASGPSLVDQILSWVLAPVLWISLGVVALLGSALWFLRRRRQEAQDVTGRWEALESEVDEDHGTRDATERMRRQVPEKTIVVEEQLAEDLRPAKPEPAPVRVARPATADETLSSQTVINLDQADAIAEADFHIAYGLYDQAAELVQKALDAAPGRRDLKLKLLEVFFMWGNKEAFLKAAQGLRADVGSGGDPDWDKVVIMGRQICPDERLFTEATPGAGSVDVDLEAGDSPLDLAFDDSVEVAEVAPSNSAADELDFNFEPTEAPPARRPAARPPPRDYSDDSLDIGAKTAAGLEAALFEAEQDDEDTGRRTTPDLAADSLAVTQESPTIERPRSSDWATAESPTLQYAADAPTVETPTIESPAARAAGATKTMAIPRGATEPPTIEQPALASGGDFTAEIDLDDLGLDVKDLEGLPSDLGDLPAAGGAETDTREQRALRADDALLSATGITKVLDSEDEFGTGNTSVLEDQEATLLSPGFDDGTLTGTEVLQNRQEVDEETGSTSLVRSLRANKDGGVDLDLEDLTVALHGADTVEQPRATSFSRDVFGGGDTPLDIDIGRDLTVDDEPTGTEEVGTLDPQTMTEIGTKLDLARAYIDMGDPEGARSILEEVLDEGDPNQRREAQGLIDVLSA